MDQFNIGNWKYFEILLKKSRWLNMHASRLNVFKGDAPSERAQRPI